MANHPRYKHSLDELFLHVYVYIDDWLKPYRPQLPKHSKQKASISELLTIAVVGELLAQPVASRAMAAMEQRRIDNMGRVSSTFEKRAADHAA